jgi:hypothetical protein
LSTPAASKANDLKRPLEILSFQSVRILGPKKMYPTLFNPRTKKCTRPHLILAKRRSEAIAQVTPW